VTWDPRGFTEGVTNFHFLSLLEQIPLTVILKAALHAFLLFNFLLQLSSHNKQTFQQILQLIISPLLNTRSSLSLFLTSGTATMLEDKNINSILGDEEGTNSKEPNNVKVVVQREFDELFDGFVLPDEETDDLTNAYFEDTNAFGNFLSDISMSSDSSGLSYDFDIDPTAYGNINMTGAFSAPPATDPLYNFDTLNPRRMFRNAVSEQPTTYVTPAQVTYNFTPPVTQNTQEVITTTSGSLLDLSIQSMDENTDEDTARKPRKERRVSPKHSKKPKTSPYPTPPASDDDTPSPRRRNGHIAGYNRKTGEPTLVGIYPPCIRDGVYYCPLAECREVNGKDCQWSTKNGYKYHLIHCCLQNPDSDKSQQLIHGELIKPSAKGGFSKECVCGAHFKSENGYKLHLDSNASTKDGKCVEKARRKENRAPINRNSVNRGNAVQSGMNGDMQYYATQYPQYV
jgi:hypothetical protein